MSTLNQINVSDLKWSGRAAAALKNTEYKTLAELDKVNDDDLLKVSRLGRKSLYEIREKIVQAKARDREDKLRAANERLTAKPSDAIEMPEPVKAPAKQNREEVDDVAAFAQSHRNTIKSLMSGEMVLIPRA